MLKRFVLSCAVIGMVLVGWAQPIRLFSEDFEGYTDSLGAWQATGLWKLLVANSLTNETRPVVPFPSGSKAAYFGNVIAGRGTYHTGAGVQGTLTTSSIDLQGAQYVKVEFRYFRQVEHYTTGEYDKTLAKIKWSTGETQEIFKMTSKDASVLEWVLFEKVWPVPTGAQTMSLVFEFDSVDAYQNDYFGWAIDNIVVWRVPPPLTIVTETLGPATIGSPVTYSLVATGGVPDYTWALARDSQLPRRLELSSEGVISGIPEEVGTFTFTVIVTDSLGSTAQRTLTLTINPRITLFFEDFENISDWSYDPPGLWHTTNNVKGVDLTGRGMVAYYGKDDTTNPNYDTEGRTWGALVSPEIDLIGSRYVQISFKHWRWVESYHAAFDQTYIQVSFKISGMTEWTEWVTPAGAYKDARYP